MADNRSPDAKKNGPLMAVLVAGILVVIALLGVIVFLLLGRGESAVPAPEPVRETVTQERAVVVNEDNVEQVMEEIVNEPPVAVGYYEVNMNFSWTFPDGASPSDNAYVENSVSNNSAVYFDVLLEEDESVVLYESPVLPVGTHVNEVTLARDLDAGTYPCVVVYHLVDDQQRTTSTLRMNMEIVINN